MKHFGWLHIPLLCSAVLAQLVMSVFNGPAVCSIAVVPQGGNTGLAGASVPYHDEVIISLKRMNKVIEFTPVRVAWLSNSLTCAAIAI